MSRKSNGHWASINLGEVAWVVRGRIKPQERADLPFIGMENVEAHSMRLLNTVPAETMKSSAVHFQSGDVLYGRLRPYLNKVISVNFEGLASAEFIPLTTPNGVNPEFVKYRVNTADFVAFTSTLDEGDRPRVDYNQIREFEFLLPPTQEQHRIIEAIESYLTRLDDAVATLERVQRNLERYRASVLKAAVEGRLVPTEAELAKWEGRGYEPADVLLNRILKERRRRWIEDTAEKGRAKAEEEARKAGRSWTDEDNANTLEGERAKAEKKYKEPAPPDTSDLPDLPEGWCWATALQVCDIVVDCHNKTAPYVNTGIPLLRTTNIRDGKLLLEKLKFVDEPTYAFWSRRCPPLPGDVLFTREAPMGEAALIPEGMKVCMGQRMMLLRANSSRLLPSYLLLAVQAPHIFQYANRLSVGTGVKHLRVRDVENLPIPMCPVEEQARVADAMDRLITILETTATSAHQNIGRCQRLRQSVLKWAFEGKLVDQDTSDEPASVLLERIKEERASMVFTKKDNSRRGRKRTAK